MLGETIKTLRKERAWSQAHLAEAAGVSVRTVQRLERRGQCSDETLLAVAAALDVEVQALTRAPETTALTQRLRRLGPRLDPKRTAAWGAALMLPALLFVAANVLKFEMAVPFLYDGLAAAGKAVGVDGLFEAWSPLILLGGPAVAVVTNLLAVLHLWGDDREKGFSILGVDLVFHAGNVLVLAACLAALTALLGYLTVENLGEWIEHIAGRG
ncbi:helix-turn-helix domain-containing protein [Rhodocaloribacter sp.]